MIVVDGAEASREKQHMLLHIGDVTLHTYFHFPLVLCQQKVATHQNLNVRPRTFLNGQRGSEAAGVKIS